MKDPEEKTGKPESKPGVSPGPQEKRKEGIHEPGTITEVAPETRQRIGPIKEMAPDVAKLRPEVAPDVRVGRPGGPIQEMAPETRGIHPEVAPDIAVVQGQHHLMYAPTIHGAIAEGNLSRMRDVARQAEHQLQHYGDLRTALEILKVEIAKMEHKQR